VAVGAAEDAGIGDTPHRWAKAASERGRWGLSPAVTSLAGGVDPRLKAGPAGGRLRRPSSAGSTGNGRTQSTQATTATATPVTASTPRNNLFNVRT
jgi:hypothetical protein